ncbi:MAG: Na/Pi cotransporter family protein, partial [Clostridia bacterium]|nr:Na/Pi cotransporter family protein [Clostridia bacterium]
GLPAAVYVIFGSNIGTCFTSILSSIGTNKTAKKAAIIHLSFNVIGVILFAVLIQFVPLVQWLSATALDTRTQIAIFHTIFNSFALLVMIWYPQLLIKISNLVIRGEDDASMQKKFAYIGERVLDTPSIAVGQVIKEVGRMAELAEENFELSMESLLDLDEKKVDKVLEQEQVVNFLNHEITDYLAKLSAIELATNDALIVADLFHIVNDIERISDHAENITEYTNIRIDDKVPFSEEAIGEIKQMSGHVQMAIANVVKAFETNDDDLAQEVIRIEQVVDDLEAELKASHIKRVALGTCTPRSGMIFTDLVTDLERVADHATNIAYYVLKSEYR